MMSRVIPTTVNFGLMWDTETTTIGKAAEIVQISVVSIDEQFCSSEYVTPEAAVSLAASTVHGLASHVLNGINVLHKDGNEVQSVSLQECLGRLLNFIETTCKITTTKKRKLKPLITVMVGHNSALFDTPVLLRSAGTSFVDQLKTACFCSSQSGNLSFHHQQFFYHAKATNWQAYIHTCSTKISTHTTLSKM